MGGFVPTEEDLENPCGLCEQVYDGKKAMQKCANCTKWFHNSCVSGKNVNTKGSFLCITCQVVQKNNVDAGNIASGGAPLSEAPSSEAPSGELPPGGKITPSDTKFKAQNKMEKLEQKLQKQEKQMEALIKQNQELAAGLKKEKEKSHSGVRGGNKDSKNMKVNTSKSSNVKKGSVATLKYGVNSGTDSDSSESDDMIRKKSRKRYQASSSSGSQESDSKSDDSESDEAKQHVKVAGKSTKKQLSLLLAQQELRELPSFDGHPTQWCSFYRTYKESKRYFTDIANRNRLQKALKGKALSAVSGLLLSPSTIKDAVNMLKFRFGQTEHIIQDAINQAISAEQPNENRPESIVDYAMLVLSIKANIEAVGDKSELVNPMLVKTLVERLPYGLQKKWNRRKRELQSNGRMVKISSFSKWLLNESQDYVDMLPVKSTEKNDNKKSGKKMSINLHHEEKKVDDKKNESSSKPKIQPCSKCSSDHKMADCPEFNQMLVDQRRDFARKNQICFVCLKRGHRWRRCYHKDANGKRTIHKLLDDDNKSNAKLEASSSTPNSMPNLKSDPTLSHHQDSISRLFKILPVVLYGPVSQLSTYALLDECASSTLIDEDVVKKLKLSGPIDPLLMSWTKDITYLEDNSMKIKMAISGTGIHSKKYSIKNVRTVQHLALPSQSLNVTSIKEKFPYLAQANLDNLNSVVPTILLGLDNTNLIASIETIRDPEELGPVATRTNLGWSIHGPETHLRSESKVNHTFLICECQKMEEVKISELMDNYFSVEDFGVKLPKIKPESIEDKRAKQILMKSTARVQNGFVTGLLWRVDNVQMPNNYSMCLRRLTSIELKMKRDAVFEEKYCAKIREYVSKGYARKLSRNEFENIQSNMWILPHFGTSTLNKPKLRLVFDAKATCEGISLNSQLLTGPDQYNSLVGVLYKFRQGRVAVAADIRDMFHRIKIKNEDQRFQCFLWRDGEINRAPDVYVMVSMIFGARCSPCSAQYVKNVNALEFENENPRAVNAILNQFYVDDYMDSFDSETEALNVTEQVIRINERGNFELRHVISNSKALMQKLGDKEDNHIVSLNKENESCTEKVLGLYWDIEVDELLFKLRSLQINTKSKAINYTRREVLRIMMSVFDPLGLLAHYVVRAKIILQEIWMRKGIDWDSNLPDDLNKRWLEWLDGLKIVSELRIPRNYSSLLLKAKSVQLHVFTDASERAYSAVAFMRVQTDTHTEVKLITGKTKVASQKCSRILSMPRQELQGTLLGSRLAAFIIKEHSIQFEEPIFWTDSQTVLAWIRTEYGSYKQFVAHRIAEILEVTRPAQWRYISSKLNPADDATKPTKIEPFDINNRWFNGPDFLKESPELWPVEKCSMKVSKDDPEVRRLFLVQENCHSFKYVTRRYDYKPIDPNQFSNWHHLIRITAWAKRGLYNWSKKLKGIQPNFNPLSLVELKEAEMYHIKKSQLESYPFEIRALLNNQAVSSKSKIRDLMPFLDEYGVMKMKGRIECSPQATTDMKMPMIIDRKHKVTHLILQEFHERFHHQFQETVVNEVRTRFWIPQLRVAVKQCKKRCQKCKNDQVVPLPPQMSKLPMARLKSMVGCFHYCGVDLFGPMFVAVKRSREKRWGVIFTCLTTRAVYLDLVPDLSSDSMILSIRNCNARRGPIHHLFSDQGTNFIGAQRELKEALDDVKIERIQRECIKLNIEWHFNPPASPHMGGCWERMVRSVKGVLSKLLKEKSPKDNTLRSLLCEIEDVINMRPLTYIALENDSDDVLTPKHFLNAFFRHAPPEPGEFSEHDLTSRKQWRFVQELTNHFWRKWTIEYLPMITRTTKWHEMQEPLAIGDMVIICDNTVSRNTWEKGRIVEVRKSNDGQVRSASVKTSHGILHRPVVKLAKLDIMSNDMVNP